MDFPTGLNRLQEFRLFEGLFQADHGRVNVDLTFSRMCFIGCKEEDSRRVGRVLLRIVRASSKRPLLVNRDSITTRWMGSPDAWPRQDRQGASGASQPLGEHMPLF